MVLFVKKKSIVIIDDMFIHSHIQRLISTDSLWILQFFLQFLCTFLQLNICWHFCKRIWRVEKRNTLTNCTYISYPKINAVCIWSVINDKCCEWVQFRQQTSKMQKRKMELSEREGNIQHFPSFRSKGSNNKKITAVAFVCAYSWTRWCWQIIFPCICGKWPAASGQTNRT